MIKVAGLTQLWLLLDRLHSTDVIISVIWMFWCERKQPEECLNSIGARKESHLWRFQSVVNSKILLIELTLQYLKLASKRQRCHFKILGYIKINDFLFCLREVIFIKRVIKLFYCSQG